MAVPTVMVFAIVAFLRYIIFKVEAPEKFRILRRNRKKLTIQEAAGRPRRFAAASAERS